MLKPETGQKSKGGIGVGSWGAVEMSKHPESGSPKEDTQLMEWSPFSTLGATVHSSVGSVVSLASETPQAPSIGCHLLLPVVLSNISRAVLEPCCESASSDQANRLSLGASCNGPTRVDQCDQKVAVSSIIGRTRRRQPDLRGRRIHFSRQG
jgi:hypothetical protein